MILVKWEKERGGAGSKMVPLTLADYVKMKKQKAFFFFFRVRSSQI
jgi:hypothetical protein